MGSFLVVLRNYVISKCYGNGMNETIHSVFGSNLRALCATRGTITAVAKELEINRVQMNRFLNGESFPKPGLLKRICDYFNVDGRILLQPLSELTERDLSFTKEFQDILRHTFYYQDSRDQTNYLLGVGAPVIQDGMYVYIRRAMSRPGLFIKNIVLIKNTDAGSKVKSFSIPPNSDLRSSQTPRKRGETKGFVMRTHSGICVVNGGSKLRPTIRLDYLDPISFLNLGYFTGFSFCSAGGKYPSELISPCIYERLPDGVGVKLRAARDVGFHNITDLKEEHRAYLDREYTF